MTRPPTAQERQRLRSPVNLLRALVPLVVLVAVVVALAWPRSSGGNGVHVIDPSGSIIAAQQQARFTVLVPTALGSTWRPTSAEFIAPVGAAPASLRVGYVSPTGKYAELFESSDSPDAVSALYGPLTADAPVLVDGTQWQGFRAPRDMRLLLHTVAGVTVIVTGSAPTAELTALAASLK